jgi:hypothetical protein
MAPGGRCLGAIWASLFARSKQCWLAIRTFWWVFDVKKTGQGYSLAGSAQGAPGVNRAFFREVRLFCTGARRSKFVVNIAERLWGLSHETNFSHRLLHVPGFGPDG